MNYLDPLPDAPHEKFCKGCNQWILAIKNNFKTDARNPDGFATKCKECTARIAYSRIVEASQVDKPPLKLMKEIADYREAPKIANSPQKVQHLEIQIKLVRLEFKNYEHNRTPAAFVLSAKYGMTTQQIADVFGMSPKRVEDQLDECIAMLKEKIK